MASDDLVDGSGNLKITVYPIDIEGSSEEFPNIRSYKVTYNKTLVMRSNDRTWILSEEEWGRIHVERQL